MRFTASWDQRMKGARVWKFGFQLDDHVFWKSDAVKSNADFRRIANDSLLDTDHNKFQNIWIWSEITDEGSMGLLSGYIGKNFMKIVISSQEDNMTTSAPPRMIFRDLQLMAAVQTMSPPGSPKEGSWGTLCQMYSFYWGRSEFEN
jgi:hypothetical protein